MESDNRNVYASTSLITNEDKTAQTSVPIRIDFNPRKWKFNDKNPPIGFRSFITDFCGKLVESWQIGDWSGRKTEIECYFNLEPYSDYVFSFWLNGGENENNSEVCRFEVMFDDGYEDRYSFNLNRDYIKYAMHYKGWYLYEFPFNTGDSKKVRLTFVAYAAPCTVIPARELSYYENLEPDKPRDDLPQRPNLTYPKGYPEDAEWSWKVFGTKAHPPQFPTAKKESEVSHDTIYEKRYSELREEVLDELHEELKEEIRNELIEEFREFRLRKTGKG